MRVIKLFLVFILFSILTILTQIGGVVLLISLLTFGFIEKQITTRWMRISAKVVSFILIYLLFVFAFVPWAAKPFGRVPLPVFQDHYLKPANIWTCLLNRNYVKPQLKEIALQVAIDMNKKFPGVNVNYLDANFPFIDKFPLFPHLSHNDGKKLDISFQYNDRQNHMTNEVPSWIGYGICEEPKASEVDTPALCDQQGYWQYNLLHDILSNGHENAFAFNVFRTKELIGQFVDRSEVSVVFLEPHLKARLGLNSNKVRFHGCHAVRHDDHFHVQLK
jgi:energy-coupling factor transporter transmembrane protein EcfT